MLSFGDTAHLFSLGRGMEMALEFATVSVFADVNQPKGLYVPFSEPDINRAIAHGAIAALWKNDAPVPRYIPNDFPLFMAEDVSVAFTQLVQFYLKKMESKDLDMKTTFIFYGPELREKNPHTYDLADAENRKRLLCACRRHGREKA
ncbi:MAG: hypothetical protein SOH59_01355 [Heyndrickxia faecalis]|jgi:hypothetical protein|uniref:hypothetical protein n=1 Tax=Heyndrickxia TaxID=2837504 RepID=UPI00040DA214|nr:MULTISPECIES: hypothetical protein [Heyndrickxia]AWP36619.1 hypothetical protein CYJ15_06335 [Heyndrickxia coagulans]KGT38991.1 hypothetical protein P421_07185 [Heyndrickxia coagulans P38]KYC61603.1 hypothetical protein B4100_0104 [Heyndrickxia coagulans]MCI1576140.1 hypothetical protein [Heyndrickxia coagulans]MED4321191.1 hypothetical protein [Weizmannia sp. CD-2023]